MIAEQTTQARRTKVVLRRISELPTLPAVVYRMLDALGNPRLSMGRIAEVVSEDPALATKVLRLANSPYYGFAGRVCSIEHAMVLLGLETVKALALGVSIFNTFHSVSRLEGINGAGLWTHFLAVAVSSKEVAAQSGQSQPEVAFTAGLVHDIGRLALLRLFPKECVAIIAQVKEDGTPLIAVEEEAFGLDHQMAGMYLAKRWRLPKELQNVMLSHHASPSPDRPRLVGIVHLSDQLCRKKGMGWTGDLSVEEIDEAAVTSVGLSLDALSAIEQRLSEHEAHIRDFWRTIG